MKEIIMRMYELNERYHDTKEKMAWLASSLYAGFSVAIIRIFFTDSMQDFIRDCPLLIIIFLSAIFVCVFWFINFQYHKKRRSVKITGLLEHEIFKLKLDGENKLKQIFDCINKIHNVGRKKKKKKYRSTECPINMLIITFFITQIIITLYLKGWIWEYRS